MLNSIGDKIAPWGTPQFRGCWQDFSSPIITVWVRSWRKEINHLSAEPCIPIVARQQANSLWSTVSNAAERSSSISSAEPPWSRCLLRSSMRATMAVSTPWPGRKPDWKGSRVDVSSRKACNWLLVRSLYPGMADWRLASSLLGFGGLVWISSVEVVRLLFSGFVGKSLSS